MNKRFIKHYTVTTILAGFCDLAGAIFLFAAVRRSFPVKIFEYIAGGIYGSHAMDGGWKMNVLGAALHFLIAGIWTLLFYIIYPYVKFLHRSIWVNAIVLGIIAWSIMNLIVLPLSAWKVPVTPFHAKEAFKAVMTLIVCIGIPIAWRVKRYYRSV